MKEAYRSPVTGTHPVAMINTVFSGRHFPMPAAGRRMNGGPMIGKTCINCGGTEFRFRRDEKGRLIRVCGKCSYEAVFMFGETVVEVKTDDGGPEAEIPGAF